MTGTSAARATSGPGFERRTLLRGAAVAAAASVPFQALAARTAGAEPVKLLIRTQVTEMTVKAGPKRTARISSTARATA